MTIILEINLQKYIFGQIISTFLAANVSFLNGCYDENLYDYTAT